jgi:hypothetical protein
MELLPGHQEARHAAEQSQDLQFRVMRFADRYAGSVKDALADFQSSAEDRVGIQTWKSHQVRAAYSIASGPDPRVNALDMVVLASLSRTVVDDWRTEGRYGDQVRRLQEAHREMEEDAWGLADDVLNEAQTAQLHDIISRWRQEHPQFRGVANIRFDDLAKSTGVGGMAAGGPGAGSSLFSVLGLDPLSGLDPAVQEINQTRQLGERSIYYLRQMPSLIEMQAELFSDDFFATPETKSLLASVDRASLVGDASERMIQSLPAILLKQREALLAQLMQGFDERSGELHALSSDVRSTLAAGTETANALHATLETADRISARDANTAASRPFDIREYTEAVREAAAAARELNALTERTDTVLPAMRHATDESADRVERLINHLFVRLLMLIVATIAASLLAALGYRAFVARRQNHDAPVRVAH